MRFKRYLLILIASVFLLWAICILGGPTIIKNLSKSYFGSEIILYSVKVTPRLGVYIGRVEFRAFEYQPGKKISGFARQIEFDWSLIFTNQLASIRSSEIHIDNDFKLDGAAISFSKRNFWDFNNLQVSTNILLIQFNEFGAERIDFNAHLDRQELEISNLSSQLNNAFINKNQEIAFTNINVNLDSFDLESDWKKQLNNIEIEAENLRVFDKNVNVKDISAKIENHFGTLITNSRLKDISAYGERFFSDYLSIQLQIKVDQKPIDFSIFKDYPISLTFEGARFENYKASNIKADASFSSLLNPLVMDVSIQVDDLILETADFFIGEIPSILMTSLLSLDLGFGPSGFKVIFDGSIIRERPKAIGTNIQSEFFSEQKVIGCLTSECLINNGVFNYEVVIEDTKLAGSVKCTSPPCKTSNVTHSVEINKTNKFFKNILEAKLFNPLLIAYLQSNIMSGQKFGIGHKKIFQ